MKEKQTLPVYNDDGSIGLSQAYISGTEVHFISAFHETFVGQGLIAEISTTKSIGVNTNFSEIFGVFEIFGDSEFFRRGFGVIFERTQKNIDGGGYCSVNGYCSGFRGCVTVADWHVKEVMKKRLDLS